MNSIAVILIVALLLDYLIDLIAGVLNLRHLATDLPENFKQWYDRRQYAQAQQYLKTNTRFGWVAGGFDLAVLLVFWLADGFPLLDAWVRQLQLSPVFSGMVFIAILAGLKAIVDLPFGIYATFVIEERFGFNKTTWKTYVLDRFKALALAVVLGAPLLAVVLAFFHGAGDRAWWYCWLAVTAFMLLIQYIAPTWILPLFNRYEALPPGDLRDAIVRYAEKIHFGLAGIFVMDGSRRSTKSNAFFTGFGRHRRIVLFDTLVARHTVDELVAVLAHEMGHYKLRHIPKNMALGIAQAGLMFYILSFFISYPALFQAFGVQEVSVHAGLIFFGILYTPIDNLASIGLNALSRRHEFAADGFAVRTTGSGAAMTNALKKLSVDNLSNLRPHPLQVILHYSHPPVLQRIAAIEQQSARS